MTLPRGITGFRDVNEPPLPVSEITGFRAHCHAAMRELRGRVLSIEPSAGIARNFVEGVLEFDERTVRVLLNAHFPLVAFAAPSASRAGEIVFVDVPDLAGVFAGFGVYEVLTQERLNEPLTQQECEQLTPAEREQIRYWRPTRIGEVVFNVWD